jgi:hypothetical protein
MINLLLEDIAQASHQNHQTHSLTHTTQITHIIFYVYSGGVCGESVGWSWLVVLIYMFKLYYHRLYLLYLVWGRVVSTLVLVLLIALHSTYLHTYFAI